MMTPYTLLLGDCRVTLATLPAASVQCCITSPPYYGLRAYNTPPQVWGGESACAHQWGTTLARGNPTKHTDHANNGKHGYAPLDSLPGEQGTFCQLCGAWRGELGQEPTLELYLAHLVEVFRAVRRVLRPDGTLWLNLGDSYSMDSKWGGYSGGVPKQDSRKVGYTRLRRTTGLGDKQLMGVPWRAAFALQADGWLLRADIIWHKPNALPESVTDRPTKAHEYLFLLTQQPQYYYDAAAIKEPTSPNTHSRGTGLYPKLTATPEESRASESWARSTNGAVTERNKRSVWTIPTAPYPDAHFSTFPPALVEPAVLAGSRPGDTVLDPFAGTGTTLAVAVTWRRQAVGCELNPTSAALTRKRLAAVTPINLDLAAVGVDQVAADQPSLWNEVCL